MIQMTPFRTLRASGAGPARPLPILNGTFSGSASCDLFFRIHCSAQAPPRIWHRAVDLESRHIRNLGELHVEIRWHCGTLRWQRVMTFDRFASAIRTAVPVHPRSLTGPFDRSPGGGAFEPKTTVLERV